MCLTWMILPRRIRAILRRRHRSLVLGRGTKRAGRTPRGSDRIWRNLIYGWGNEDWSAQPEYLDAVAAAASRERGPILECGCGLTTIVLANIARQTGSSIFSLEHDPSLRNETLSALDRFGLRLQADVRPSPMRDYGDFEERQLFGCIPMPV